MNAKFWTCKDKTKIRIRDMTNSHLLNTIHMLERQALKQRALIPYPNFQGEMAQYYAEQEWNALQEEDKTELASRMFELYDDLVEEALNRKILTL